MHGIMGLPVDDLSDFIRQPWVLVAFLFQVWMFVDAIRRGEYFWAACIFFFPIVTPILYFFLVCRASPSVTSGFELPGAHHRRRIHELQGQIHHLDKAHHHLQLGDIYFQQGKLAQAEVCYRASLERDGSDLDAVAHLGQCLLRQNRPQEALPLLQRVCTENPKHDYGHSLMAYAETLSALGKLDDAIQVWEHVIHDHSYARARVQLAELYLQKGEKERAQRELKEVIADDVHTPGFQRKRDRLWLRKARRLLRATKKAA